MVVLWSNQFGGKMTVVVGINLSHDPESYLPTADGGVAIAIDGVVHYACAEERISRSKYDGGFSSSLQVGLQTLGLARQEIDLVGIVAFGQNVDKTLPCKLIDEVRAEVGLHPQLAYCHSHHEGHAWSSIGQLGVKDALIAVLDHTGSIIDSDSIGLNGARAEQTSYYLWRNEKLVLVARDHDGPDEVGYGRMYSKVTRYVGFDSYHDAGKLMGLSSFGNASRIGDIPHAYYCSRGASEVTSITDDLYSADGLKDLSQWLGDNGAKLSYQHPWQRGNITAEGADLASWCQHSLETSVLRRIQPLVERYCPGEVAICGGVALNSVLNGVLSRELPVEVRIPNSPGDAGLSLGALQFAEWTSQKRYVQGRTAYTGPSYSAIAVEQALALLDPNVYEVTKLDNPISAAASALAQGLVVGWFRGRSEFGPRALGNRSILCAASHPWIRERVNGFVKKREWFRPFAPAVLSDQAADYFEIDSNGSSNMMKAVRVRNLAKQVVPSIVHVDGTARIQTVAIEDNPDFYELISAYMALTGVPVLMNTSFNEGGRPLVESPTDAVTAFLNFGSSMDRLYLENYEVRHVD